jgi:YggT family protein
MASACSLHGKPKDRQAGRQTDRQADKPGQDRMTALIILIDQIVNLYIWTMVAYIIITWLIAFKIVNPWQPIVRMALTFLGRIHEPLMGMVRRVLPDLGGIDVSPIILLLAAQFLRNLVISFLAGLT